MLKNWRAYFGLLILFLPALPSLALELKVTPVYVLNAAAPTQVQSGSALGWTGSLASSYGLITSLSLWDSPFDLEIGLVQLNESSKRESSGLTLSRTARSLHYPLLIRFNLDSRFSLGLGGYMSISNGSTPVGIHDRDFGLLFSARSSLQLFSNLDLVLEGRYQHGLSNLATLPPGTAGDLFNTRSIQALIGFCYSFSIF